MKKDFDKWNENKKSVNNSSKNKLYRSREIWWCTLGVNIGFEQDGTGDNYERPVLVFRVKQSKRPSKIYSDGLFDSTVLPLTRVGPKAFVAQVYHLFYFYVKSNKSPKNQDNCWD